MTVTAISLPGEGNATRSVDMDRLRTDVMKLNLMYLTTIHDVARTDLPFAEKLFHMRQEDLQSIADATPVYLALAAQALSWTPLLRPAIPDQAWCIIGAVIKGQASAKELASYLANVSLASAGYGYDKKTCG